MRTRAIKTPKINKGDNLISVLDNVITSLKERSVVAITSNIVSLCEENVVKIGTKNKKELIEAQADYYLPPNNTYHISITIKNSIIIPSAGIDESNTNGYYTLWPKDAQKTADTIRAYLKKRFQRKEIGILIVDSKTTPLRWGVTGVAIAHSGFSALNDYSGKPDIFGRLFVFERANISDALASSAVLVMGEGSEQTPLAIIDEIPFVRFQDRNPSKKEIEELKIAIESDVYGEILQSVPWKKGKGK